MKSAAIRQLCIDKNYFTCGSNEQYNKMFDMVENNAEPHDIALVIWICSEDADLEAIEASITDIMGAK